MITYRSPEPAQHNTSDRGVASNHRSKAPPNAESASSATKPAVPDSTGPNLEFSTPRSNASQESISSTDAVAPLPSNQKQPLQQSLQSKTTNNKGSKRKLPARGAPVNYNERGPSRTRRVKKIKQETV